MKTSRSIARSIRRTLIALTALAVVTAGCNARQHGEDEIDERPAPGVDVDDTERVETPHRDTGGPTADPPEESDADAADDLDADDTHLERDEGGEITSLSTEHCVVDFRIEHPVLYTPPLCTPYGATLEGCGGWVRGHHVWEIAQTVMGIDIPRLPESLTGTLEDWQALVNHPDGAEVEADRIPTVSCDLAVGCPTLERVVQLAVQADAASQHAGVRHVHQTASGDFIVGIFNGFRRVSATGEPLWTLWPLGEYNRHTTVFGLPGTDDTIVGWGYQFDDRNAQVCRGLRGLVSRISGEGTLVWTRPVSALGSPPVRYVPETRLLVANVVGGGPSGHGVRQVVLLNVDDGSWDSENAHFEEAGVILGSGARPVASQSSVVAATDGGSAALVRTQPMGRAYWRQPEFDDDPADFDDPYFGMPFEQVAIRWFDGSWLVRGLRSMYLLDFDSLSETAELPIRDRFYPARYSVGLAGHGWVTHDGTLWVSLESRVPIGIVNPFAEDPDDTRLVFPRNAGNLLDAVVAQDGTVLHRIQAGRLRPFSIVAAEITSGTKLWEITIPDASTPGEGSDPPFLLLDDGTLVIFGQDGVITWWSTVHGGLAHTPAPREQFDNYNSGIAREGPFPTEPEKERAWRLPQEVEADVGADADTSDHIDAG